MRTAIMLITLAVLPTIGFSQTTWYVPDDFTTIQGAISDASVVNGDTVIVRAGTYVENIDFFGKAITLQSEQGPGVTMINGNQAGSVVTCQSGEGADSVLDGFTITNGYANSGGGMSNESSSPTLTNCTFTGNSATYNGAGMFNESSSPTLTNCTFAGNSATYNGGGMFNYSSSPTLTNCTFTGNTTGIYSAGGGMFNQDSSSPTVTNCIFWNDTYPEIYNLVYSYPTVTYSCVQGGYSGTGNIDDDPLFVGGGDFHITYNSPCMEAGDNYAPAIPATDFEGQPRIVDGDDDTVAVVDMGCDEFCFQIIVPDHYSTIQEAINASQSGFKVLIRPGTYVENINFSGKAITLQSEQGPGVTIIDGNRAGSVVTCQSGEDADSVLDGFTITNGSATYGGGMYSSFSNPTVTSCIFNVNLASYGGGMWNSHSSPTVTHCTFSGNWAEYNAGGMYNHTSSSPTVSHCTFSDNTSAGYGGGMKNNYSSSPTLTHCTFTGNSVSEYGGGISNLRNSNPTMTYCTFSENYTYGYGTGTGYGAGIYNYESSPTVTSCTIIGNSSNYGGGMWNSHSSPTVTNCTFTGNLGYYNGGGMYNYNSSSPTVTNCTFTGNSTTGSGGGMRNYSSSNPTVTNCILWTNTPDEIYSHSSSPSVTYSCIQDGHAGTGNIDADPMFLDPLNDDYHLTYASPCIDAGDNNAPSLPTMDFEGDPRIVSGDGKCVILLGSTPPGATVDMGADEYCLMKRRGFIPK